MNRMQVVERRSRGVFGKFPMGGSSMTLGITLQRMVDKREPIVQGDVVVCEGDWGAITLSFRHCR